MAEESISHFDVAKAIAKVLKESGLSKSGQKDALDLVAKGYKLRLVPEGLPIGSASAPSVRAVETAPKKAPKKAKNPGTKVPSTQSSGSAAIAPATQSGGSSSGSPNTESKDGTSGSKPTAERAPWNQDATVLQLERVVKARRAELVAEKAASGAESDRTKMIHDRLSEEILTLKAARAAAKSKLTGVLPPNPFPSPQ